MIRKLNLRTTSSHGIRCKNNYCLDEAGKGVFFYILFNQQYNCNGIYSVKFHVV